MQVRSCLPDTALPSVSRFASLRSDVMHPSSTAAGYGGFSAGALGAQSGAQSRNVVGERKDSKQYESIPRIFGGVPEVRMVSKLTHFLQVTHASQATSVLAI